MDKLREFVLDQHGFVTSVQAAEVSVSRPSLSHLVKNSRIERVNRGIYHVPQVLRSPYDALHQALL